MLVDAVRPVELSDVTVARGERIVLRNVSARFEPGTVTALAGANGSGKSTLLEAIAGVLPLDAGTVAGVSRRGLAFVPQRSDVPPHLPLTVADAVGMGRWRTLGAWRRPSAQDRHDVDRVIDLLALSDLRGRPLQELSGGQRQRTLVAQGLASRAPVLLLDEPTAGVDAASAYAIDAALRASADEGAVVIHATHDAAAIGGADAVLRLESGRILARSRESDRPSASDHLPVRARTDFFGT